jgi:hypothetical protein
MESDSTAFINAKKVFECVDTVKTFDTISEYVAEDAAFECHAAAMDGLKTVKDYTTEWMVAIKRYLDVRIMCIVVRGMTRPKWPCALQPFMPRTLGPVVLWSLPTRRFMRTMPILRS